MVSRQESVLAPPGASDSVAVPRRGPIVAALDIILIWLGFYAGWSAVSIPLTLATAPFVTLWGALAAALATAFLSYRCRRWLAPVLLQAGSMQRLNASFFRLGVFEIVGLSAIGAATLWFIPSADARPLWAFLIVFAAILLLRPVAASDAPPRAQQPSETGFGAFFALAVGILAIYLIVLRPDADDAFYLNLPIGLISSDQGMMARDTMYGLDDWPFMLSSYRVETLSTLTAAMAWASGVPVPIVHYTVLPAIWCVVLAATLTVIGHGFFGSRWWVFALISVLVPMALAGGSLSSWGAHGIARLFHGKAPLMLIVVPLIVYAVIRFDSVSLEIGKSIVPLLGLELAALGLTANAIYLAPLTLGLSVTAGWIARGCRGFERFFLLFASIPPLAAGVWLLIFDRPRAANMSVDGVVTTADYSDLSIWRLASSKLSVGIIVLVAIAALAAYRAGPRGRWPVAFLLSTLLFVINPFLMPYYDKYVTGGLSTRLYWALPGPMILAVAMTWLVIGTERVKATLTAVIATLALLSFLSAGLFALKGTGFSPSLTKRPSGIEERVALIREVAIPNRPVLAPEDISSWLPTFETSVPVVFVRLIYLPFLAERTDRDELSARLDLLHWMQRFRSPTNSEILADMSTLCPGTLVLDSTSPDVRGTGLLEQLDAREMGVVDDMILYSINPPGC